MRNVSAIFVLIIFSLILGNIFVQCGVTQKVLPLREPDQCLNWTEMTLVDKQVIKAGFIGGSINHHMIFKSNDKIIEYDALSVDEYTSHNVGENVSVGIGSDGYIHSIHHGNDYGQYYNAIND